MVGANSDHGKLRPWQTPTMANLPWKEFSPATCMGCELSTAITLANLPWQANLSWQANLRGSQTCRGRRICVAGKSAVAGVFSCHMQQLCRGKLRPWQICRGRSFLLPHAWAVNCRPPLPGKSAMAGKSAVAGESAWQANLPWQEFSPSTCSKLRSWQTPIMANLPGQEFSPATCSNSAGANPHAACSQYLCATNSDK